MSSHSNSCQFSFGLGKPKRTSVCRRIRDDKETDNTPSNSYDTAYYKKPLPTLNAMVSWCLKRLGNRDGKLTASPMAPLRFLYKAAWRIPRNIFPTTPLTAKMATRFPISLGVSGAVCKRTFCTKSLGYLHQLNMILTRPGQEVWEFH